MGIRLQGSTNINQNDTSNKKERSKYLNCTLLGHNFTFFLFSHATEAATVALSANNSRHNNVQYSIANHDCSISFSNFFSIIHSYTIKVFKSEFLQKKLSAYKVNFSNSTICANTFVNTVFLDNCKNIFVHIPLKTNL